MPSRKKLLSEQIFQTKVVDEDDKALEFYKAYKEISDISEKISIAMGRRQTYKYSFNSTQNCKIKDHASSSTAQSYKV